MALTKRQQILLIAPALFLATLLVACSEQGSENADDKNASLSLVAQQSMRIVETPNGRWQVAAADGVISSRPGAELQTASIGAPSELSDDQLRLMIEDEADMRQFLTSEVSSFSWPAQVNHAMQAVPGVPDDARYADSKYDPIRDAFTTACIRDAQSYVGRVVSLYSSDDLVNGLNSDSSLALSSDFESNCLRKLAEVPLAVRRVVGVLRMSGGILCSATIVAERELLTARHCFFNSSTGDALTSWSALSSGTISFHTAELHSGQKVFSVRKLEIPSSEPFKPYEDAIRLSVLEGPFAQWAVERSSPIQTTETPLSAWVVGSNALIGDVNKPKHPFEFVRGASPKACAILEVTSAGCLYHTCQAGASTSGAGLLVESDDGVILQGVHKSSVALADNCETAPPLSLNMNVAAQYPSN